MMTFFTRTFRCFLIIVSFACLWMLSGCWHAQHSEPHPDRHLKQTKPDSNLSELSSRAKSSDTEPPVPEPQIRRLTLAAVGDILIHGSVYKDAQTGTGYDFTPMFEPVKPFIEKADIAVANQETMIGGTKLGLSDYPRFNSPFEVGDALKSIGMDVVTLANNHTLDRGEQAVLNALDHWDRIGMVYTGAFRSKEDRQRIRTVQKNGITLSFLAYTYGTNGIPVPEGKDHLVNLMESERIRQDVEKAASLSDGVVVSLHFGQEYQRMPNDEQKKWAQEIAGYGADIILGHHPHVLQPVEWIQGKNGKKTLVIYSLGNFISGQEGIYKEIGGILQMDIVKKSGASPSQGIEVENPVFIPTWTFKERWRNYKVYPLSQVDEKLLPGAEKWREDIRRHMTQWMSELIIR